MFAIQGLYAQTVFVIDQLPEHTPQGDSFFLAGIFNEWDAADTDYRFEQGADGKYYTKPKTFKDATISFLITRGSWETVETGSKGVPIVTRKLSFTNARDTVVMQVEDWSDTGFIENPVQRVTIKLVEIPENTPPDAPIYIAGNFNGWVPGDKRYRLDKAEDGTFSVQVPVYWTQLAYKFTRGNWHTVEGKAYGRPRLDRVSQIDADPYREPVVARIMHWEDQSSGLFNPYTLILILTAIQGILLILIINSYENNNRNANRILSILLFLISFVLLSRVSIYDRDVYKLFPRLSLLPDLVYFLYAPLFMVYIKRLLKTPGEKRRRLWLHFIPFALQVLVYIPLLFEPVHLFIDRGLSQLYPSTLYITIGGVALLFNMWYWFNLRFIIARYLKNVEDTYSTDQNIVYLNNIMALKAICLGLWLITYIIGAVGYAIGHDFKGLTSALVDTTWVVFSLTVYLLGYFAIKQPEIFKIHEKAEHETAKLTLNDVEIVHLKEELKNAMEADKAYLNPSLNLPELAQQINSNVHMLSRAINEGFDKNFRDFVNYYRVMDFIDRAKQGDYKNQTFLGIALDVGFNSKSSFNRSFKKITGKSPRDYFNTIE
ncbi:helix-turn-helix domain-containing protein [Flavobacteriaceae bacterium 3-367]